MGVVHGEAVLRQRICLGQGCHAVFFICAHCDRGHRYCSDQCRQQARRQQRRRANRRHQQSPEGSSIIVIVSEITAAVFVKRSPP